MLFATLGLCALIVPSTPGGLAQEATKEKMMDAPAYVELTFPSADGLEITADLYRHDGEEGKRKTPFIVLCHQAGWSRGEYREIAPKLMELGFDCLAIDQRSGGGVNEVTNETNARAQAAKKSVGYVDAEQDLVAALEFVHKEYAEGPVILWGSSYSSALSLRIAGEHPKLVNGVLAFAPGEYFGRSGKPEDWVTTSAKKISVPTFVTSAKREESAWKGIFEAIPGEEKSFFLPRTEGNHGSRALWEEFEDSPAYWEATSGFLAQFLPKDKAMMDKEMMDKGEKKREGTGH